MRLVRILSLFLVLAGLFMVVAPAMAGAGKVTVCHATGSATNPYVRINVSVNSVASAADWMNGHGSHPMDTWDAFTARNGDHIAAQGSTDVCKGQPSPTGTPPAVTETPTEIGATPTATDSGITPTATDPGVTPTATDPGVTPTATDPGTPGPTNTPGVQPTRQPKPSATGSGTGAQFNFGWLFVGLGLVGLAWPKPK